MSYIFYVIGSALCLASLATHNPLHLWAGFVFSLAGAIAYSAELNRAEWRKVEKSFRPKEYRDL